MIEYQYIDDEDINLNQILESSMSSISFSDSNKSFSINEDKAENTKPKPNKTISKKEKHVNENNLLDFSFFGYKKISEDYKNKSFSYESRGFDMNIFSYNRKYSFKLLLFQMKKYKRYKNTYSLRNNLIFALQKRKGSIFLQKIISKIPYNMILYLFNIVSLYMYMYIS